MDLEKKLEQIKPYQLNCNVFSVYDYPTTYSMQELLNKFFETINNCVDLCNNVLDLAKWLVNEGLELEVAKKLEIWLQDGTLASIINEKLFGELNAKIDLIKSSNINVKELEEKVYEINELMREIDQHNTRKKTLNNYIDYMIRKAINHIGFDCSNTKHILKNEIELNSKIVDLLTNHYKSQISKINQEIESIYIQLNNRLK